MSVAIHLIEAGSDILATSSVCPKCTYVYLEYALSIDVLGKYIGRRHASSLRRKSKTSAHGGGSAAEGR